MTAAAVSPTQLASMLACTCNSKVVCPAHRQQYPNGPVKCRACPEPLDPILWADGLHVGCEDPAPIPAPPAPQPTLFAAPTGPVKHPIKDELIEIVRWAAANAPRSLQTAVGPSEIGVDCLRRLAYRYAGTTPVNTTSDPWFSIVGTAVHDWLAVAIDNYQAKLHGPPAGTRQWESRRYWVEERVTVVADQHGVSGSCDLYDLDRGAVVDHKIVGDSALKKYVNKGPSNQYRTQVHLYGRGHELAGRPVNEVAIAFYPRSGYLTDLHVWSEPYNRQLADDAMRRAATVKHLAATLPIAAVPATPDPAGCTWCAFYRPGGPADATGCPGPTNSDAPRRR